MISKLILRGTRIVIPRERPRVLTLAHEGHPRYYEIEIMRSTTSEKITKSLERIFMVSLENIHGLPLLVSTDYGLQFVSSEFERYLESCGIEHKNTTPL